MSHLKVRLSVYACLNEQTRTYQSQKRVPADLHDEVTEDLEEDEVTEELEDDEVTEELEETDLNDT